ncbi:MAG: rhomboid family intramembrane serine protease [Leptolyngbyaceae cyanobacterium MO_188.B28]|nr:rhomboid family intramembrane serine protease [Leptolyngbyaceae cyanobacterium MO_188.B28]
MSFNTILIQLVGLSCLLIILRAVSIPRGWVIVSGLILSVLAGSYWLAPDWAGLISGGLWGLFIIIPCLGLAWINRLVAQEKFSQARKLATCLRWLHPADGLLDYPDFLHALEVGHQGHTEEAQKIFRRCRKTLSSSRLATALIYRLEGRWDDLLKWIQDNFSEKTILNHSSLGIHYLRALGETGDLNGLLQMLDHFRGNAERQFNQTSINLVRLFALAFCGQVESVRRLCKGPLASYSPAIHEFWLATAELAAGNEAAAQKKLLALREHVDAARRHAIDWRLSHRQVNPEPSLTHESQEILHRLKRTIQQEAQYDLSQGIWSRKVFAVWGLIGVNVLVFILQVFSSGSQDLDNLDNLYRLGGLAPSAVLRGEWWRLLSSTFLHAGFLHLLLNMLALYFLGAFLETTLGARRLLLAYFFSGVSSMLTITILAFVMQAPNQLVVGASGAIMGLLGVVGALLLDGWRREKSRIAIRRLQFIVWVVGFQVVFDLATPEVSFLGHITGLIWGFLLGGFLTNQRYARGSKQLGHKSIKRP